MQHSVWKSNLPRETKHFFEATVESALQYGCESIDWSAHTSNEDLYRGRPKLSSEIAARRMRLAGHCQRHKEQPAGTLVLWELTSGQGHRSQGGATNTFVDALKEDTGAKTAEEIARCMENWDDWRHRWNVCLDDLIMSTDCLSY